MTAMVGEHIFVDTNVLVYTTVVGSPLHDVSRNRLTEYYKAGAELWISRQVMREYLATLTRPQTYAQPQPVSAMVDDIRQFEKRFQIAEDGPAVMIKLLELVSSFSLGGKQIHDANIVAT
jgi:predicted nucleic acid-binding protein